MSAALQLAQPPSGAADLARDPACGFTVAEFARRYRVGCDKVRSWIAKGELKAINTASSLLGKPRWVIPADALAEFEKRRSSGPAPKPPRRRRRAAEVVDYFP